MLSETVGRSNAMRYATIGEEKRQVCHEEATNE